MFAAKATSTTLADLQVALALSAWTQRGVEETPLYDLWYDNSGTLTKITSKSDIVSAKVGAGFVIAEADLNLRGPGDIEGTQQSGIAIDLKIADLGKDNQILMLARDEASHILEVDPNLKQPEHVILDSEIKRRWKYEFDWGQIS